MVPAESWDCRVDHGRIGAGEGTRTRRGLSRAFLLWPLSQQSDSHIPEESSTKDEVSMTRRFVLRWAVLLACCVFLLPACGDSADDTAEATVAPTIEATSTTAAPTTTAQSSTSTTVAAEIGLPGPGEPWDVLFIAYDDGATQSPGELYAAKAADILDVEVRFFEPPGFDHTYTAMFVEQLRGNRYPSLGEYVPGAEIIVLWTRPGFAPDGADNHIQVDYDNCHRESAGGTPPTADLSAEYWETYRGFLDEMYDELWALRQGAPTVLITADWGNWGLPEQRASGIESECRDWIDAWSAQLEEAANKHGSHFVSFLEIFNGPDRDQDPADFEDYVARAADALVAVGFEATTQP